MPLTCAASAIRSGPADGYTIDQFAADVVAFMDAVGIARATLIGHSMGTFIARRVAQIRPKRVARLAFIGSSITALNDVTLEVREGVRPLADPLPLEFVREFQASALKGIPGTGSSRRALSNHTAHLVQ